MSARRTINPVALHAARMAAGLSMEELAEKLGRWTTRYLREIEAGREAEYLAQCGRITGHDHNGPTRENVEEIAAALGVSGESLLEQPAAQVEQGELPL